MKTHVTEIFETRTCKRCGGTGEVLHISNLDGGRCYGCGGKGKVLTARGRADYDRYLAAYKAALSYKAPAALERGDKIKIYTEARGPWYTVESIVEQDIVQANGQRLVEVLLADCPSTPCMWPTQAVAVHPGVDKFPRPRDFASKN